MDFSSTNTALWGPIVQIGVIAGLILGANILRRKVKWIRNSLMPTAVLAGFALLLLRTFHVFPISALFLETITYHAIAVGFIALSLRIPEKQADDGALIGSKSGALIVSTYLVQALVGLVVSLTLSYTLMPELFQASGILLPMAYGQGPGQANNVGGTYEKLGMVGGRSFGLSLAAVGYLCACVVGVVFLNVLHRKGKIKRVKDKDYLSGSVTVDTFQDKNEMPVSESVDKFSVQMAIVFLVYLLTYLLTKGIVMLLQTVAPGLAETVGTLLWGFNFIVGSMIALLVRIVFAKLRKANVMKHQYQNNYLLNRVSGVAFDLMIVAGIASIDIDDLTGHWLPFLLMAVLGGIATFVYLYFVCKKLYPRYHYEAFFSMFGMLTGTISSGVLLLRELDPELKTPASNNLVTGSSFAIVFGIPMLLLISFAPQTMPTTTFLALGIIIVYLLALMLFMLRAGKKKK